VTPQERWLGALWPLLQERLPAPPASVVDLGCGRAGGFVPLLRGAGYNAIGVDPEAPDEAWYRRVEFERADLPPVDAVVASTSLHHVADPPEVVDRIVETLEPGGVVVVFEWASERFDQQTARWCSERVRSEESWLHDLIEDPSAWFAREHLHPGEDLLGPLDERLERRLLAYGPYFFPDLMGTTEADEQAAIDGGQIQAGRIDYVGTRPRSAHD
jgi:SAM-dependent methyltransferase